MKVVVISKDESIIYQNKIYVFNDVVDMDDVVAESLMKRGYVVIETEDGSIYPENEVVEIDSSLDDLTYQQLKKMASELKIDPSGKKSELVARLRNYVKEKEPSIESDDGVQEEEPVDELPNTSMPE